MTTNGGILLVSHSSVILSLDNFNGPQPSSKKFIEGCMTTNGGYSSLLAQFTSFVAGKL